MSEEFDLFRCDILDDLPEKMIHQIKRKGRSGKMRSKILILFEIKKTLSSTEVMIGLFRKFNISTTIESVRASLSVMKKAGLLENDSNSKWRIL